MFRIAIFALMFGVAFASNEAFACTQPGYADNGRYIGGDLFSQLAERAETIQIVRVTARHLYRSTSTAGENYLRRGEAIAPASLPDIVNEYVYGLSVIETLKGNAQASDIRILAYDAAEWREFYRARGWEPDRISDFNAIPDWLMERPGDDGGAFLGGAVEGANIFASGSCNSPYMLDMGQTFVAFRDAHGRLYQNGILATSPLEIDAEFQARPGQRERVSIRIQALVPNDSAFEARIRAAVRASLTSD